MGVVKKPQKLEDMRMFLIRNGDGKFYQRSSHYYGLCWTEDLSRAKVYTKDSTARSRVTYFAKKYPNHPIPERIEIVAGEIIIHDEAIRIAKVKIADERREERRKLWEEQEAIRSAQRKIEQAQKEIEDATAKLKRLKGQG